MLNRCLFPINTKTVVPDTTLCDKVCQWLAAGRWFSPGTPTGTRIPDFSSFGPSRDYGMDLNLEVYLWAIYPYFTTFRVTTTGTCYIQKIYAPSSSLLQGKHLPFTPSPLRLNIFRLIVILSLTQLYRYTPEIFLFSTATFKYKYRAPLRRIRQECSAKVAYSIFQSLKRIQPLPVCVGFFICIRNSLDRPCVTMPSWSSPLKCKVSL